MVKIVIIYMGMYSTSFTVYFISGMADCPRKANMDNYSYLFNSSDRA